jgi:hypothetical protein
MSKFWLTALFLATTRFSAPAVVFWNLDNSANQSDPGSGAPWNSVAKVVNSNNSSLSGSAVYLGSGFLLTANHVTVDATFSRVTFDNTTFFDIDPAFGTYGTQVAAGVDMKVIKLTLNPAGVNAVTLLTSPIEQVAPATVIGWGIGRDPGVPLSSTNVTWGNDATAAKRWGLNEPKFVGTDPYDYLGAIAGASGPGFVPGGLGDAEASVALYDSGSGLFQEITNTWYLIGITTSTEDGGSTDYGIDSATASNRGDADVFARVSSYDTQITALVPEPASVSLLGLAAVTFVLIAARGRR